MKCYHFSYLLFVINFVRITHGGWGLQEGRTNVMKREWYVSEKYHKKCHFWKWGRCTRYRAKYQYNLYCKTGWSNDYWQTGCIYAICDGKIKSAACNKYYSNDIIRRRDGSTEKSSGGKCSRPNICTGCNNGFYSDGPYCRICPPIDHCNHRDCRSVGDNHCEWCDGEIKPKKSWRAYVPYPKSTKTSCLKACSWRSDSTRCFPGTCAEDLASNCNCMKGFGGHHCDNIIIDVDVKYAEAKLIHKVGATDKIITTPIDPNDPGPQPIRWTNNVAWQTAELEFNSKFPDIGAHPPMDPAGETHYVKDFKYGIIYAAMELRYDKGGNYSTEVRSYTCYSNENLPMSDNHCNRKKPRGAVDIAVWDKRHGNRLSFKWTLKSGGYLLYIDREASRNIRVSLKGKTHSQNYIFQWDLIKPYHQCVADKSKCSTSPVKTTDVTDKANVPISWDGWKDDMAGLHHYEYQVFELASDGSKLVQGAKMVAQDLNITTGQTNASIEDKYMFNVVKADINMPMAVITLKTPGLYSATLIVYDKALNYKATRCVILYDNQSKVDTMAGKRTIVEQSSKATNYTWISVSDKTLKVSWTDRFINFRHKQNHWLGSVGSLSDVVGEYDDHYGKRSVDEIPNAHGVVRFEVKYEVYSPALSAQQAYTPTVDVLLQFGHINVPWNDGNRLDITVRAYDILEKFAEETIVVYKDVSPPRIENLWLSRGDNVNISVHSIEDFSKMTIEWEAFDFDSGLNQVEWRLFDNYTSNFILHGKAELHAQGMAQNLTICESKYESEPRGSSCYCTMFHGCYHKHFHVKPKLAEIGKDAGLITGKDKGVHDSDYFIEIQVINNALIKTTAVKKITIDVSPPHEGTVHDGIRGDTEVDYQTDLHLDAHWEGFFDRESGVEFYRFIFADYCFTNEEFKNSNKTQKTYNTFASFDAPNEGTYFISVLAVNRAMENSNVVCSDGVNVMTTIPYVKDFVFEGSKTRARLIQDNTGSVWLLDHVLQTHLVGNISSSCNVSKEQNITVFPIGKPLSSYGSKLCKHSDNLNILAVVVEASQFKMSWESGIDYNLIHDYEVGLSSTTHSSAPDIVPFRTTKHHTHFRLNHPDVPDGKEFHVILKSISKAGVEGIQSIGPFIVDTTKPQFSGVQIDVKLVDENLIANWSVGAFVDPDDPFPMHFQYAVGHKPNMYDIQPFRNLQFGGPCFQTKHPTCTALPILNLKWALHGHHAYYFTIKATNLAGLSVTKASERYIHDVQLPAEGVVTDVLPTYISGTKLKDNEDIDFTSEKTTLAVAWSGFKHPHQLVNFSACIGTVPKTCDVLVMAKLASNDVHIFNGLTLHPFQMYYVTIESKKTAGSVNVSSDGVRVLDINKHLTGIVVRNGNNCSDAPGLQLSHHKQDTRPTCHEDDEFQTSTTTLTVYWDILSVNDPYIRDAFVKVEERLVGNIWKVFKDYEYIGRHKYATLSDLDLKPGNSYRAVVKFCAENLCFPPVYGNGVTVLISPPSTGNITLQLVNMTNMNQLYVTFEKMYDPDIKDHKEAQGVVTFYEWALGDNVGLHTVWNEIDNLTAVDMEHARFVISLNNSLDFSKCRKVFIRGYNKAGVWSMISKEIKTCTIRDGDSLIVPNIVIDAVGIQEKTLDGEILDGYGHDIILEENGRWEVPDVDYSPYKNIISATWPLLRHKNYTWAVIDSENLDVTSYYQDDAKLQLRDPCSHPDSVKCGFTEKEYINAIFSTKDELEHGKRYIVCIHAPRKEVEYEKWTEVLYETNICSDGVTVDLTPPTPGHVWIGIDHNRQYQAFCCINVTFCSNFNGQDIFISWDSFTDVEEYKKTVHNSGIKEYQVGIGSTKGGTDIFPFTSVGLVNHYTIHELPFQDGLHSQRTLRLQNGHEYYATVKGLDFATRSSTADSHPVKIDNTPPEKTVQPITIKGRHMSDLSEINACWRDVFIDKESGIDHYLWSVGSHPGHDDIIPFTKTTLDCGVSAEDKTINIHEGHAYFITVKAINRANLISTASSWAYVYDMSPPVAGHVYDGSKKTATSYMKDIDYQTDVKTLSAYWEGFHDPHSTIKAYFVSIGTCQECEDVLVNQDIGISNNFTLCHMHLGSGIRYYTTITACNTADMCTPVTSDGVIIDNSPPTQGIVLDGVDVYDIEYQSLRNYISAKWYGFTDPQSGIDRFAWRVGTKPGSDDIVKSTHLPRSDILVEPDLLHSLPRGQRIYVTIKAYNKAGLGTEAHSNGFFIDDTPPLMKVKPYLSTELGSIKDNSIVFRSTIRIHWEVEDKESFIQRQYLSIASHRGGEFNTSSTELNGIVREYTFSQIDLHDGGNYTVKLIVCNGAKICVEDESKGIVIDSSPPTSGMFAIKTDHAANLHRHVDDWMNWSRYKLWLSWLGFTDLHTGIDKYFVSLGSKYMTDDFNKISGSPQEFLHNQSGVDKYDEGYVQTFEVDTKNLAKFEHVFVSVWAVNQIGLPSRMIHSQFKLVPGGSLELIRRCSAVTCQGHCVCAAQGQRCSKRACNDVTKANNNNLLGIYDITNIQETSPFSDVKYTPSNVALAAKWHVVQAQGLRPLWYEWTAGYSDKEEPEGVFDNLNDDVWHHAGQTNQAILNIKRGQRLKESPVSYSIFVRVWYDENTFADFKTDGILAMSTPLPRRKIKGSAVVEQIPGHWKKDIDYIKPGAPFTIRWTNVFKDDSKIIDKFKVYLSTYPGGISLYNWHYYDPTNFLSIVSKGHDIHEVELDLPGSITSHNISRVPLSPGKVFYSNVVGYSYSGIHATETSDGIMVDSQPPVTGTVYDGIGIHDIDYKNNSDVTGASWHGFSDRDSGLTHYMWCVQTKSKTTTCDVRDWENVGIHHSVSRIINSSRIDTGAEIESLVYAMDVKGHKSKTVKSNGIMLDSTHPEPTLMEHLDHNLAENPSFEDTDGGVPIDWDNIININVCNSIVRVSGWNSSIGSCVSVLKSDKNLAIDGRSFVLVEGQISQTLNLKAGHLFRVTFVTAHPPILGAVLANKEGYVEIGDKRHVFMVYTKQDKHGSSSKELNWHHHTFYFRASTFEATISIGSMTGHTGILFDDLKVQRTIFHHHSDENENGKHIHAHVVALHQWSSIHASWNFVDPESPIIDYMWAIGYTEGSTEVQGFTSVGLNNFAYNYNVSLAHTSVIHITVIATNAAGLRHEVHAEDLLVDLTPPYIDFINDGIGSDIDAQTTDEVSANWEVHDSESGIDVCEWAVGYQPFGNEIQTFQELLQGLNRVSKVFPSSQISMQMLHVTLRCRSKAGLMSSKSSNGVKISNLPPNTTTAEVEILPHTLTEYNPKHHYQGDTSYVRVKWTGFEDLTGVDSYLLTFHSQDKTTVISKSIIAEDQDTSFCVFTGLDLRTGNFTTSIKAVNKMYLRSEPVSSNIVVSSKVPALIENPHLQLVLDNRTLTSSWEDHFKVHQPLYYEVSAGTTLGGADIIQWQETKNTFLEFQLPQKIKSLRDLTGYISVRCVSANGMTSVLNAAVKL